ncbi:MAG: acetate kinase [Clostridia bacterium]|nr:acetate kinase [Clostridia bacterium]
MNVLVINAGSSSLKYQLFDTAKSEVRAKGNCERIGIDGRIVHKIPGKEDYVKEIPMPNHSVATRILVETLTDPELGCLSSMAEIEAVGHRIVHGGPYFSESVLLTQEVYDTLDKKCRDLAPLHTGAHLQGIRGCLDVMPDTPQILVFDTAFHQTMPPEAFMYGIPYKMYKDYAIRRYGAHGTSHRYVSGEMIKLMGGKAEGTKIVTCHLGNGSSISAVKDGKVIDTSMGFTPLAGVIMGTRCGDMDPAVVPFIMKKTGKTPDEMSDFMNKECGFQGISEVSSDCRDLEAAIAAGNPQAKLAMDILGYQIKRFIGAYTAAMGGLDAIVFTAGIGENTASIRERALTGLEFLGVDFDRAVNDKTFGRSGVTKLSTDKSRVLIYMIPTNEELMIAKDAERLAKSVK